MIFTCPTIESCVHQHQIHVKSMERKIPCIKAKLNWFVFLSPIFQGPISEGRKGLKYNEKQVKLMYENVKHIRVSLFYFLYTFYLFFHSKFSLLVERKIGETANQLSLALLSFYCCQTKRVGVLYQPNSYSRLIRKNVLYHYS